MSYGGNGCNGSIDAMVAMVAMVGNISPLLSRKPYRDLNEENTGTCLELFTLHRFLMILLLPRMHNGVFSKGDFISTACDLRSGKLESRDYVRILPNEAIVGVTQRCT